MNYNKTYCLFSATISSKRLIACIHYFASKVRLLKQLCLQEDELCFTLLQNTPKKEIKEEEWSKVCPLASKVALEDELCMNLSVSILLIETRNQQETGWKDSLFQKQSWYAVVQID